jgi:hypothetical protein
MGDQPLQFPPHLQGRYRRFRAREKVPRSLLLPRLIILPHTLMGLFLLVVAMPGVIIWAAAGDDHTAQVTRLWTDKGSKGRLRYNVAYTYPLPTGQRQSKEVINSDLYHRLNSAAPDHRTLQIRAIKAGPIFYDKLIDGPSNAWGYVIGVWLFSLFWCTFTGVFVYLLYIQPFRQRLLYRSGNIIAGKIVSKRTQRGKSTTYYLRYAFALPDGRQFEKEMPTKRALWENAQVDQPVTVLYFPANPKRSVVYDYGPYECIDDQ